MKSLNITAIVAVALMCSTKSAIAQGPGASIPGTVGFKLAFDETGASLLNGGPNPNPVTLIAGGGINFQLPGPVIPGFVLFGNSVDVDPTNPTGDSDLLIFSNVVLASGITVGVMTYESLLDPFDPLLPADVPVLQYPVPIITMPEVGPEGANGFTWIPDPPNLAGAVYVGISDGRLSPEPSTFVLGGMGVACWAAVAYRRRSRKIQAR